MKLYCCEDRNAGFVRVFYQSAIEHGCDLQLIDSSTSSPSGFDEFQRRYLHRSVNSEHFELACFRRYFTVRQHVQPKQRFVVCDSDLLILNGLSRFLDETSAFPHSFVASIGISNGISEEDISPHFSVWTTELLDDFLEYLISAYDNDFDRLEANYELRQAKRVQRPSISDMTLLYLWTKDRSIPFLNSNRVFDAIYLDHNISMTECVNHRFRSELGRKCICIKDGAVHLVGREGNLVAPVLLHLQGRYKMTAKALYQRQMSVVRAYSLYIFLGRSIRTAMSP